MRSDEDVEDYKIEWKRRTHVQTEPEQIDPISDDDLEKVSITEWSLVNDSVNISPPWSNLTLMWAHQSLDLLLNT